MDLKLILLISLLVKFGKCDNGKIIGGQILDITSVPYFVSVEYKHQHICGGSILNELWIISAAHCSQELDAENFNVRSGTSRKSRRGQLHTVEEIQIHPNYNSKTLDNDFMLLKLDKPMKFDEKQQPIQLAFSYMYYEGAHVLISGYGETQNKFHSSEFLRGAIVDVTNTTKCVGAYKTMITPNMFCAAGENKDSCQGDSGGPAESIYYGTLLGVVSFGVNCADEKYPGVYSKISEAKEWILSVTGIEESK